MIKSHEYSQLLQKLFNPSDNAIKLDIAVLKEICSSQDYRQLADIASILIKLFLTSKQRLSIRELIGQGDLFPFKSEQRDENVRIDFFIDSLSTQELLTIIRQLQQMRLKLKNTVYSLRLLQIIEILKKIYRQLKPPNQEKKEDQLALRILGDFEVIDEEFKKCQNLTKSQMSHESKSDDFWMSPGVGLTGRFSNYVGLMRFMALEVIPIFERNIMSIPLNQHTQREGQITRALKFISRHFICQYQLEIQISKNTLVETRLYQNKIYKEILYRNQRMAIKAISHIINQAILCPSSINIQILTLRILRRLYNLWEYSAIHSSEELQSIHEVYSSEGNNPASIVRNPLFLVIRNIALFSEGREEEVKEAAMLSYKLINDKNDLQMQALLQDFEELRFLKNSKYYSSKAYTYADQVEKIYEPLELGSLYLKTKQLILARQVWTYTVLVEKPSSLLCWQLYLNGYDIKFGIFKLDSLRQLTHEQYEKNIGCKELIKYEKIQNGVVCPHRGHLYLKNGIYRFVFDNSFSMMRSKELLYTFLHLESSG